MCKRTFKKYLYKKKCRYKHMMYTMSRVFASGPGDRVAKSTGAVEYTDCTSAEE